jgi:hypothetical protein
MAAMLLAEYGSFVFGIVHFVEILKIAKKYIDIFQMCNLYKSIFKNGKTYKTNLKKIPSYPQQKSPKIGQKAFIHQVMHNIHRFSDRFWRQKMPVKQNGRFV